MRYNGRTKVIEASTDKQAERKLKDWVDEIDDAESNGPEISMNDLFDLYLADHRKKRLIETPIVEKKIEKYLRPRIGQIDARKFGKDNLELYLDSRLEDIHQKTKRPPENATLNREISIISRALRLAAEKIQRIVVFEKLEENPPRQGIVDESTYQLMVVELPDHVKAPWCFAYYTGVRSGELLKLRWEWLDWNEWVIRVPGWYGKERMTKNGRDACNPDLPRDAGVRKDDVSCAKPGLLVHFSARRQTDPKLSWRLREHAQATWLARTAFS